MNFRQATTEDIPQIQIVRNSVKENQLSKPNLISDDLVEEFITKRGKGFACEIDKKIVGFSIVEQKPFTKNKAGKTLASTETK